MFADNLTDQIAAARVRAREIDGADHDVKRIGINPRCSICGKRFRNDPRTPHAPIHVEAI